MLEQEDNQPGPHHQPGRTAQRPRAQPETIAQAAKPGDQPARHRPDLLRLVGNPANHPAHHAHPYRRSYVVVEIHPRCYLATSLILAQPPISRFPAWSSPTDSGEISALVAGPPSPE